MNSETPQPPQFTEAQREFLRSRKGRQILTSHLRRNTRKATKAAFHAGAAVGGSICPRCHSAFATPELRNAHRRTTCTAGAK